MGESIREPGLRKTEAAYGTPTETGGASGVEGLGEVGDEVVEGTDPHGTVMVVPSPDAVRENVPAVLDV